MNTPLTIVPETQVYNRNDKVEHHLALFHSMHWFIWTEEVTDHRRNPLGRDDFIR